jgi:hypothetical protein
MYVRKIEKKTFTNPHTKLEETKATVTFCSYTAPEAVAGMSLPMPDDAIYGNIFLHSETLEQAEKKYRLGADYSEWLEFGAKVDGYDNLYKVMLKSQA